MGEHITTFSFRGLSKGILAALVALSLMVPGVAFAAPTAADKQAEAQAALSSLNVMQENLSKASDDYFTALEERDQAQASMDAAQVRIDEISEQIAALQDKLGTRATSMYRSGNTSFIDLLLGSTSFEDFATNWEMLNRMNEDDAETVQQTKDLRAEAEAEKEEFARQQAIASQKTEEAKVIKDEAEATTAAMQEVYDNLSAEAAVLLEQERAAAEAAAAAQAQAVLDAAAQAAAQSSNNPSSNNPSSGPSNTSFTPSYNASTGNAIVDRAYGCMGAPYVWGGTGPSGFDCSGLVSYAVSGSYSRLGTTHTFMGWNRVSDPQPGDIAVNANHTGIYIGGGQMIHAATFGVGVIVGPVQGGMIFVRP